MFHLLAQAAETIKPPAEKSSLFKIESIVEYLQTEGINLALNVLAAIAIFIIGKWVVRMIKDLAGKSMRKAKTDETIISFAQHLIYAIGLAFVIIAVFSKLGIPSASMVAALGAAGLAVGLALQGSLANFASGVLLIFFRPFKVGDLIEAGDALGTVDGIELFTTTITSLDSKTIILPNAQITSAKIINYTKTETLRVDMTFGISYSDDLDKVRKVIQDTLATDDRILKDKGIQIEVAAHNASSVDFIVRPHVKCDDYWGVYFSSHENLKKAFDKEGISIPFPQQDVHHHYPDGKEA